MVHYKLFFFEIRGIAEVSRQLFALAGVEFEDVRFQYGSPEWKAHKPSTPFGHLPVLSVDGFDIPESVAIARYLGIKFGFAGKTTEEQAWVDAIVDQFTDFKATLKPLLMAQSTGKPQEEVDKIFNDVFIPGRNAYFAVLNKVLSKRKSGFLVGNGVTFADLIVVEYLITMEKQGLYNPSENPKLAEHQKKINSIPVLKAYNEKRSNTEF